MKGFLAGLAGIIIIAAGAAIVLENMDYSSRSSFTSDSGTVRLGE